MVKISASPHFPRLLGRTPNAFQIPPRPLDWRTGTSHSSRIDSPPPPCLPVLPNEDKWVHSPPIPGTTLYLTVPPHKAGSPCCPSSSVQWPPLSFLHHHTSVTARRTYNCPIRLARLDVLDCRPRAGFSFRQEKVRSLIENSCEDLF